MSKQECDVVKVAEAYIAKHYPRFDPAGKPQIVSEVNGLWEVTYELPGYMLGGAPLIRVDKEACKVVSAIAYQ